MMSTASRTFACANGQMKITGRGRETNVWTSANVASPLSGSCWEVL